MTLWFALPLMTFVAMLFVIVPMMRVGGTATSRDSYSLEVYRDQLQELDGDVGRGLLSDEEARAARLEIERRMLALSTGEDASSVGKFAAARSLPVIAMIAVGMGLLSWLLYSQLGTPGVPGQPFAQRVVPPVDSKPGKMRTVIEKLARRLKNEPNNLEGWTLLGQSYSSVADYNNAANAFQRALKLAPGDTDLLMSYGESLVLDSGNEVIPGAREAFEKALKIDPNHMGSRFYLAEYEAQNGNHKAAMDGWLKLVAVSSADAPWMPALMQRLEGAAKTLGVELASVLPEPLPAAQLSQTSGPDQAAVEAAKDMNAGERKEMIRGMVKKLADRLKDEPDDFEGWQRLARAYNILGDKVRAREVFAQMARLRPDNVDILMEQASLIIESSDRSKPLPQKAVNIFTKVLTINPENQDALYFSGLAASRGGEIGIARKHWKKLLELLPKDGQAWAAVNSQFQELPASK